MSAYPSVTIGISKIPLLKICKKEISHLCPEDKTVFCLYIPNIFIDVRNRTYRQLPVNSLFKNSKRNPQERISSSQVLHNYSFFAQPRPGGFSRNKYEQSLTALTRLHFPHHVHTEPHKHTYRAPCEQGSQSTAEKSSTRLITLGL
jgi:hypothetical protein